MRKTILLDDEPATADEFGSHQAIADELGEIVATEPNGHSVAILGSWGSGKSTILNLMIESLNARLKDDLEVFVYDAWAHQGDPLRRSFLDDLISSLALGDSLAEGLRRQVWNTDEETKTTTESVLRPHAKVLAGLLLLFPVAWTFLQIPDASESLWLLFCYTRNWVAVGLFAPFVLYLAFCFLVSWFGSDAWRDRILGAANPSSKDGQKAASSGEPKEASEALSRPSVSSILFQQVTGHIEKKQTRSPADSVAEFRKVFRSAIAHARANRPHLKLVIVVDNIDRLTPTQAQDFWSTMQTFFGDAGGLRERMEAGASQSSDRGYWLIAPFAPKAFESGEMDALTVQAFIDKAFWLSVTVPLPITGRWRTYFSSLLKRSFPDHDPIERADAREVYDLSMGASASPPSPRSMKLFVNSMVGLYRVHAGHVPLGPIAAYITCRDRITGTNISDNVLSVQQRQLLGQNWRTAIAALHFGVPEDHAAQLLLSEPVRQSLAAGDAVTLSELSSRPGFIDALTKFIHAELVHDQDVSLARLLSAAAAMGGIDDSTHDLTVLWHNIASKVLLMASWEQIDDKSPSGLRALLNHAGDVTRPRLAEAAAKGVAGLPVALVPAETSPEYSPVIPDIVASILLILAAEESTGGQALVLPPHRPLTLNVLIILSQNSDQLTSKISTSIAGDALAFAIVEKIAAGRLAFDTRPLIKTFGDRKINLIWDSVLAAIHARLSVEFDTESDEPEWLARFAAEILWKVGVASTAVKALSLEAALYPFLNADSGDETKAAILACLFILERPVKEDTDYLAVMAGGSPSVAQIAANYGIAYAARQRFARKYLSDVANLTLLSQIVVNLIERREKYYLLPNDVLDKIPTLRIKASAIETSRFFGNISNEQEFAEKLEEANFSIDYSLIYAALLQAGLSTARFFAWLRSNIEELPASVWRATLATEDPIYPELLNLVGALRTVDKKFELKTAASDAVELFLKDVLLGNQTAVPATSSSLQALLDYLPHRRSALTRRVFGTLLDRTAAEVVPVINIVAEAVTLPKGLNAEKVLRSIFIPIVDGAGDRLHFWLLDAVEGGAFDLNRLSKESREDLVSHIDQAVASRGDSDGYLSSIRGRATA